MPTPCSLLRSLPPIKRRCLLPPLRSLSTNSDTSEPTPESEPTRPIIRKVSFSKPLVRRYQSIQDFTFATAGRLAPEKEDGPLICKTGMHWSGAGPTIRREYNYFAPPGGAAPAQQENPDRIVIEKKERIVIKRKTEMTAPGYSAHNGGPYWRPKSSKRLTAEEHRLDRPEIETTWVDTHCHLFTTLKMLNDQSGGETEIPENAIDGLVKALFPPQVTAVVDIHCDLPLSNLHEHAVALPWPPHFKYYFSMGVHPHCATSYTDEAHESIVRTMSHPSCVAWGECGLDYFKNDVSTHPTQRAVFARQLTAAVAAAKPIIIHTRAADDDTLAILREHVPRDHRMHVHCFTAGPKLARALMAEWSHAYIGLTGAISYRDMDHVTGLLRSGEVPVERILLETDSPYMVPRAAYPWLAKQKPLLAKMRFQVSHAGMIPFTAERVLLDVNGGRAERGEAEIGLVEFLDLTRGNAARMYGIDV